MDRYYNGWRMLEDVRAAVEVALRKHGVELYSLLGVTTVLEVISSPLKYHIQGIVGREMGKHGVDAYLASVIARRVALLQSPHSAIVNAMMESVVASLVRAKRALSGEELRLAAYRIILSKPRITSKSAEKRDSSLAPAFLSAIAYLSEGHVIERDSANLWCLKV